MVHAGQAFREKEGQRVKEAWTAKDETNGVLDSDMKFIVHACERHKAGSRYAGCDCREAVPCQAVGEFKKVDEIRFLCGEPSTHTQIIEG